MHHRATECPTQYPRKLVRTTVSNDYPPAFDPTVQADPDATTFDLTKDRVNAVYPPKAGAEAEAGAVPGHASEEL